VAGGWRRPHDEKLHNLYASPNIIRMIKSRRVRLSGHVVCMEDMRDMYKILLIKPEVKRLLGRPRHRLDNNIRMALREIGLCSME
jgi:hypothetical protein